MPLNDSQRLCAEGFGASIAVIAGAGSGKTFTLKERIANAFDPAKVAGKIEPLTSINEVLAITFTERAALELKGRIRSTLKARGLSEQALLVDTAWISTIHGMCSRILRENALELGIDPAFDVVADERRQALLDAAVEEVFQATPAVAQDMSVLYQEYSPSTLRDMVVNLVELAARSPEGFDALAGPEASCEDLRRAQELARVVGSYLVKTGASTSAVATPAEVAEFINEFGTSGEHTLDDGTKLAWDAAWDSNFELTPANRKKLVALELRLIAAAQLWPSLVRVAQAVDASFAELKRAQGSLDNNDLLALTARALKREGVRKRYENRFRLVMVDEFQDTDQTQLDIIRVLAGPKTERLCVVGDPQQSIYRFRGADLSVCEGHLKTIPALPDRQIHLDVNYRSHPAILDFVDVVFAARRGVENPEESKNTGFYQRLVAGRSEELVSAAKRFVATEGPRIEVVDVEHPSYGVKFSRSFVAAHIARRFKEIHEASGRPWSHMVILLGKMTNAEEYAAALDAQGIPCAIAGGSVFAGRSDVLVMAALTRVLANPLDDEALITVLTSDIFGLSPDDLLEIRSLTNRRRLGAGLIELMENINREEEPLPTAKGRLERACKVLHHAVFCAARTGVARSLELVLVESGWLARMEEKGSVTATSRAADALKLIRMVEDIEASGSAGARSVAQALAARLETAKESPGVLQAEGTDSVRIMTIHASKGLQFPIVATSELEAGAGHDGKLLAQTSRGRSFVSLDLGRTLQGSEGLLSKCASADLRTKLEENLFEDTHSKHPLDDDKLRRLLSFAQDSGLAARDAVIRAFGSDQESLELERKIYVALTRAEEALMVCFTSTATGRAIEKRIKELDPDELGAKETLRVSTSRAKSVTPEQREEARVRLDFFKNHLCIPFAGELKGIPARIRARRATIEACGYTYLHAPAAYVKRWSRTGELPPQWQAQANVEGALVEFFDTPEVSILPAVNPLRELPAERSLPRTHLLRYAPQTGLGLLSASALHQASDAAPVEPPLQVSLSDDAEPEASATERGSAFHLMGEVAARRWKPGAALELPKDRLAPTARLYGLSTHQAEQLAHEMELWLASDIACTMAAHAHLEPEAPFFVELPGQEGIAPLVLNGFIDLLAYNERGRGTALVVDYKTGTYLNTDEKRRAAYEVQARCYAYALMCQGFSEVRLEFVFVDQPQDDGMPALCSFPAQGEPTWTCAELEAFLARELSRTIKG